MTKTFDTIANLFPVKVGTAPSLLDLHAASRNYLKFKSLSASARHDMGLTDADVANARFGDFLRPGK